MIEMIEFKTGHFQERFGVVYPAPFFGERYSDGESTEHGAKRDDPDPDRAGVVPETYIPRTGRASGYHRAVYRPAKQDLPPVQPLDGSAEDSKQAISITGSESESKPKQAISITGSRAAIRSASGTSVPHTHLMAQPPPLS